MVVVSALITLLLLAAIYAGLAKMAARFFRRTRLPWKSAFGYGAIVILISAASTAAIRALGGTVPAALLLIVGIALLVAIGAWFLSSRATDSTGQAIGIGSAALVSAMAAGMAFSVGIGAALLLRLAHSPA